MAEAQATMGARVVAIWHYPVKSMMGEELNGTEVIEHGLLGDRAFALTDEETGKAATKNPRRWPHLFDFRAAYIEPPSTAGSLPPVRITAPDGESLTTDQAEVDLWLSAAVGTSCAVIPSDRRGGDRRGLLARPRLACTEGRGLRVSTPAGNVLRRGGDSHRHNGDAGPLAFPGSREPVRGPTVPTELRDRTTGRFRRVYRERMDRADARSR